MSNYSWVKGSRFHGDANLIGNYLKNIEKEFGHIDPKYVVELARDPKSPLHKYFEWDDAIAAEEWRFQTARVLISSISVIYEHKEEHTTVKLFQKIEEPGYNSMEVILENIDMRKRLLLMAKEELKSFKIKYRNLKIVVDHVEEILQEIDKELEPV